jgi:hypothetical protein
MIQDSSQIGPFENSASRFNSAMDEIRVASTAHIAPEFLADLRPKSIRADVFSTVLSERNRFICSSEISDIRKANDEVAQVDRLRANLVANNQYLLAKKNIDFLKEASCEDVHFVDKNSRALSANLISPIERPIVQKSEISFSQRYEPIEDLSSKLADLLEPPQIGSLPHHLIDPPSGMNKSLFDLVEATSEIKKSLENISQNTFQFRNNSALETKNIEETEKFNRLDNFLEHKYLALENHLISNNLDFLIRFIDEIPIEDISDSTPNLNVLVSRLSAIETQYKKEVQPAIRRFGDLQAKILLTIYDEAAKKDNLPVRWSPSKWFGSDNITRSDRANWSKTLNKLKERKLIEEESIDNLGLSKPNKGNGISYIHLTSLGLKVAKWLTH